MHDIACEFLFSLVTFNDHHSPVCKFGIFGENFIFKNSVKRHIWPRA